MRFLKEDIEDIFSIFFKVFCSLEGQGTPARL